jgi:hypothetical protein
VRGKPARPVPRGRRHSNAPPLPEWRPFYYLLEAAGLVVWLFNAAQAKNVPGRPKTDKIDAVWLAKLAQRSMVSPSLVPTEPMRRVRDLAGSSSGSKSCWRTA